MTELSFRDFAGAVMAGKTGEAATVLGELLGLDDEAAAAATEHFDAEMRTGGPDFMMKAMGLRAAVTSRDDAQIQQLLGDCFGLAGSQLDQATAEIRRRYG